MLKYKEIFLVVGILVISASANFAQRPDYNDPEQRKAEIKKQEERYLQERIATLTRLNNALRNRRYTPSTEKPLTKEEKERIRKTLTPDAEDLAKYKDFLDQKNTGIFRIFPDLDCDQGKLVRRVDGECADIVSGIWQYSFRQKNYSFDIHLKDGNLTSKGFFLQGILLELGDSRLEDVSLTTNGLAFLQNFKPAVEFAEAKKQTVQLNEGIKSDGFVYTNSVKAEENKTYVLRVIAYRNKFDLKLIDTIFKRPDANFYASAFDEPRIDLTVAFRIIRKEKNGSLTILWKQLNSQKSPILSVL